MRFLLLLCLLLSLDASAFLETGDVRRALETLAGHQQDRGHWVTAYTDDARFDKPHPETNTFTNAMIIDLLAPLAKDARVAALLERPRAYLADQFEADGLVRYHGRPDAPAEPGVWKCAITPDTDDTALAWRIAPAANREGLAKALAVLGQYRAANGLYRTWLAPQDRYQCIDPGKDPNPPDIGIQMHLLMLLAQVDGPGARELCTALSKEASADSVWVYYDAAPLVPVLRLADLRKLGCPLRLPQKRLQSTVPGQAGWMEVAHLLDRIEGAQATPTDRARAAAVLRDLAADGFLGIARNPPLLYHNDFTAHVRRFYWSEDVGYALWLRLYAATERAKAAPNARAPGEAGSR